MNTPEYEAFVENAKDRMREIVKLLPEEFLDLNNPVNYAITASALGGLYESMLDALRTLREATTQPNDKDPNGTRWN